MGRKKKLPPPEQKVIIPLHMIDRERERRKSPLLSRTIYLNGEVPQDIRAITEETLRLKGRLV